MRFLVLVLFLAWLYGGSWYWVCVVRSGCRNNKFENAVIAQQYLSGDRLAIFYKDRPIITAEDQFDFQTSDIETTITPSLDKALDSLANFLYISPYTQLVIIGKFSRSEEINNSSFSTLGLARSNFIVEELYKRGIDPNRLIKSYHEVEADSSLKENGTLKAGIKFHLFDVPPPRAPSILDDNQAQAEISDINDPLLTTPPLIYFEPNSTYLPISDSLRTFINKTITFLRRHNDRDLMIIGHSDDQGDPEYNATLGLDRARAVKDYFVEFGLNEDQIMILSRGETEPLSANDTESNRALNRRVELSIK